ncbi:MAG: zinc-dependent alcohol dehydrogenase [Chloroflexota bacterium]|nr:zinc-binding alcohol dehydrogenase [Chloroflexota bacterium]MBI5704276.1 zinc-binding alcohol dehydrogenase [Chloroflexota bacterium]
MKARTLFFTAPKQVEIREESLPSLKSDEVLVETICSAISAGTEMLVYRGEFPHLADSHDNLSSDLQYPLKYGYACVGIIRKTGKDVDKKLRDRLVFGFHPHVSSFIAHPSSLIFPPASLPPEACSFLPNMETAVNLVQDGAPILGERVLVLGQGVVGLLVASLLKEFPLERLVTSDRYALRRKASLEMGADDSLDPGLLKKNFSGSGNTHQSGYAQYFDLTFELSGSPSALNDAIALTAFSGRIVIGSWYGEKKAPLDLGGAFHRSRIQLISSQVSTIAPALSGRWDKARRFEVAWEALKRIQPQKWITHRFPIEEAEKAYRLLDENPRETIQVIFEYNHVV